MKASLSTAPHAGSALALALAVALAGCVGVQGSASHHEPDPEPASTTVPEPPPNDPDADAPEGTEEVAMENPPPFPQANASAPELPPRTVLFYDGAERGADQWAITSGTQAGIPPLPPGQGHPRGGWTTTTAHAFEGERSWTAPYADWYETNMTSVPIVIPGTAEDVLLSYRLRGGVEDNPNVQLDGLHVYVVADGEAPVRVQYNTNDFANWTAVESDLMDFRGKAVRLAFNFKSDIFCSADLPRADAICGVIAPPFGTQGGSFEGYWVDDITLHHA